MYQALYRKWRPQTFDDVIGQEHITESLKSQIQTGHLSHAYIFIGTRGTGKTSCARILAKAVNCEQPDHGNPCGCCPACRAVAEGTATDIVELDAASNNGVENVRALRDEAVFSPAMLKKRVYIIDEVHMLSTSAFNALLKILEEPPEHLLFILATTELQKVPATILSRCQRHSFKRIGIEPLSRYLETIASRENIRLAPEAAELIAGLSEGGVRDSLSMLDQCSSYGSIGTEEVYAAVGLAGNRRITEFFEQLISHQTEAAIALFNDLWRNGKDPASLLRELSSLVRDILMLKVAPKNAGELLYGGYDRKKLREFASAYSVAQLSGMLETLQKAIGNMRDRLNPKMTAELCIVTLCTDIAGDSLEGLNARVEAIETRLRSGIPVSSIPSSEASLQASPAAEKVPRQPAAEIRQAESIPMSAPRFVAPVEEKRPEPQAKPVPAAPTVSSEPKSTAQSAGISGDVWRAIVEKVKPSISGELKAILDDQNQIFGYLEGETLVIEAEKGFYYMRLNQPKTLDLFSREASALAGAPIRARMKEKQLQARPAELPSLESLKQYDVVKFVN